LVCREEYRLIQGLQTRYSVDENRLLNCRAVERWRDESGEYLYHAELFIESEDSDQCFYEVQEILFAVPRDAFAFEDRFYSRDHAQPLSFRHDMRIPDAITPKAWLNQLITGGCTDQDDHCTVLANQGQCQTNPAVPNTCCWSCKHTAGCADLMTDCASGARNGKCASDPVYMIEQCPKSCGVCPGSEDLSPLTSTHKNNTDIPANCTVWAEMGECGINPAFMVKECPASCEVSAGKLPRKHTGCRDYNDTCSVWADEGECENNPDFMHKACKKSCGQCAKHDIEKVRGGH
jgi:hypothetical protein